MKSKTALKKILSLLFFYQLMPSVIFGTEQTAGKQMELSLLWVLPFIGILLCIAIIPLINAKFWAKNLWWISLFVFCLPLTIIFSTVMGDYLRKAALVKILEYFSFITLLASLFIISGGILIKGKFRGTPVINTIFLMIGSLTASFIGTTGASMLLIRPLIRANSDRKSKAHVVVFFIFLVSNIGGLLTPLGDPPLFLGYLQGVPFTWTFRLFPQWGFTTAVVLTAFLVFDTVMFHRETGKSVIAVFTRPFFWRRKKGASPHHKINLSDDIAEGKLRIEGKLNLILLTGVILVILAQGVLVKMFPGVWPHFGPQEVAMLILALISLVVTPVKSHTRRLNGFTFWPILEVAFLFAAIFAALIPALYILETRGSALGITKPWQFFWAAGSLSSFLDNAPTYLAFLSTAKGLNLPNDLGFIFSDGMGLSAAVLSAISCGSVFMGANTYIGNGPNFMVLAIAEENGVKMPSFFGYMLYSLAILIPTFVLVTFIFFI